MKLLLVIVATLILLTLLSGLVGALLPATRTAAHAREIAAPPERVWRVLTDIAGQPAWRPELAAVEVLSSEKGRERWIERPRRGPEIRFSTQSRVEAREWIIIFSGPAEGSWRGRLEPLPHGRTRLQVEESATVRNPWLRLMARVAFDPQRFLKEHCDRLATAAEKSP